jgi:hypothetical protein
MFSVITLAMEGVVTLPKTAGLGVVGVTDVKSREAAAAGTTKNSRRSMCYWKKTWFLI